MRLLALAAIAVLSGCKNEDIARHFLAERSASAFSVTASEARIFICQVTVYRTSTPTESPELARGFEPWSLVPIDKRVNEMAIEHRVLANANGCWNQEIREATGHFDPFGYARAEKPMTSFDHTGHVAMFYPQRNIFIAISG